MTEGEQFEELNLVALALVLARYKWLIVGVVAVMSCVAALVAVLTTPVYRAEVLMAAVTPESENSGLSALAGQLGGLADLAGISAGSAGESKQEAIAALRSRHFTEMFISERDLLPVLFHDKWDAERKAWSVDAEDVPTLDDAYELFDQHVRTLSIDADSGLLTLAIEWIDRDLASRWANEFVAEANRRLRDRAIAEAEKSITFLNGELAKTKVVELEQAIYGLIEKQVSNIMLANVREEYAFKVIDPATPSDPDRYVRPDRPFIAVAGLIIGLLVGVGAAFVANFLRNVRSRAT